MNIEIIRNTLYKSYLETFYNFCKNIGGETEEVMCEILAVRTAEFYLLRSFKLWTILPNWTLHFHQEIAQRWMLCRRYCKSYGWILRPLFMRKSTFPKGVITFFKSALIHEHLKIFIVY